MPNNYSQGRVYKITSNQTDEIYIGSTTQMLCRRMTKHRADFKRFKEGKKVGNYTSFKILEYGDAKIELLELVNCTCKDELIARESHYIRTLDCVNKRIPNRTMKEWSRQYYNRPDVKTRNAEYSKNYRKRPGVKERNAEYEKTPQRKAYKTEKLLCQCGCSISRGNLPAHKKTAKHKRLMANQ